MRALLLTIHENVDEEDLHGVKGVAETEECAHSDQAKRSHSRTELE